MPSSLMLALHRSINAAPSPGGMGDGGRKRLVQGGKVRTLRVPHAGKAPCVGMIPVTRTKKPGVAWGKTEKSLLGVRCGGG